MRMVLKRCKMKEECSSLKAVILVNFQNIVKPVNKSPYIYHRWKFFSYFQYFYPHYRVCIFIISDY